MPRGMPTAPYGATTGAKRARGCSSNLRDQQAAGRFQKREHSRKPDELYPLMGGVQSRPLPPALRPGQRFVWTSWGQEADRPDVRMAAEIGVDRMQTGCRFEWSGDAASLVLQL